MRHRKKARDIWHLYLCIAKNAPVLSHNSICEVKHWSLALTAFMVAGMLTILSAMASLISFRFRRRASLELELVALRHQVVVLRRQRPGRPWLRVGDRLLWAWLYRAWPRCVKAMVLVKPATRGPVAPARLRQILALAIKIARCRTAGCESRNSRTNPAGERCQPTLGCVANSRRAAQLGIEVSQAPVGEIYDPAAVPSLTNLAKLPAQSD